MPERFHWWMRAVGKRWPVPFGDAWLTQRLERRFGGREAHWIHAPGVGHWPTMVLNVSHHLQRKFFYFPALHGSYYARLPFMSFLSERLRPGGTFLDIGSNVGFFSLRAAAQVGPTGRVYSFEPEPTIVEALTRSAAANGYTHLETFPIALSDRDAEQTFYRAKDGTASSLVPEVAHRARRYASEQCARVRSLDSLVSTGAIDVTSIDLIKIDVEGEEARTAAGMLATLDRAGCPPIWCEVRGPRGSSRAPNTFGAVRDVLAPLGYRPFLWKRGVRREVALADIVKRADVLFERA